MSPDIYTGYERLLDKHVPTWRVLTDFMVYGMIWVIYIFRYTVDSIKVVFWRSKLKTDGPRPLRPKSTLDLHKIRLYCLYLVITFCIQLLNKVMKSFAEKLIQKLNKKRTVLFQYAFRS